MSTFDNLTGTNQINEINFKPENSLVSCKHQNRSKGKSTQPTSVPRTTKAARPFSISGKKYGCDIDKLYRKELSK